MESSAGMPCQELVEVVTAYLDGVLPSAEYARCDAHLEMCAGCRATARRPAPSAKDG